MGGRGRCGEGTDGKRGRKWGRKEGEGRRRVGEGVGEEEGGGRKEGREEGGGGRKRVGGGEGKKKEGGEGGGGER
ncbi:hypothetical protein, partial [Escherichia coli]|uniref:hypothetical protein n=1 Tax=Escherichia coli TaxID=562 RepID=UPI001BC82F77